MQRESEFFAALFINRGFRNRVLSAQTRRDAIEAGIMGVNFGLNEKDWAFMDAQGDFETAGELQRAYQKLVKDKVNP